MTQTHDPAVISYIHGRQSHPYDLWCCIRRHGVIFCDDYVEGLSYTAGSAYRCPVCALLIFPKKTREQDEKRIRKHLKDAHNITGDISVFINQILWHNGDHKIILRKGR